MTSSLFDSDTEEEAGSSDEEMLMAWEGIVNGRPRGRRRERDEHQDTRGCSRYALQLCLFVFRALVAKWS